MNGETPDRFGIDPAEARAGCRQPAATRTVPSAKPPPLTVTGVPSGNAPTATARVVGYEAAD